MPSAKLGEMTQIGKFALYTFILLGSISVKFVPNDKHTLALI
jgi:hypothetical protein